MFNFLTFTSVKLSQTIADIFFSALNVCCQRVGKFYPIKYWSLLKFKQLRASPLSYFNFKLDTTHIYPCFLDMKLLNEIAKLGDLTHEEYISLHLVNFTLISGLEFLIGFGQNNLT